MTKKLRYGGRHGRRPGSKLAAAPDGHPLEETSVAAVAILTACVLAGCGNSEPSSTPSEAGATDVTLSDTAPSDSSNASGGDAATSGEGGGSTDGATDGASTDGVADGGITDGSEGDASPDAALPNVIFVSSKQFPGGSLGGLAGADTQCQMLAMNANLPGRFIAYLSTSTASASDRTAGARGWVRTDGKPVADLASQLGAGELWYPITLDENGMPFDPTSPVATGSNGATCQDWTSSLSTDSNVGGYAAAGFVGFETYGGALTNCAQSFDLYCLQVSQNVPVPKPHATGRYAFLILPGVAPSSGLASIDAMCQSAASSHQLPGTYQALLPTSAVAASDCFDQTGPTWVRPDGVEVFKAASDSLDLRARGAHRPRGRRSDVPRLLRSVDCLDLPGGTGDVHVDVPGLGITPRRGAAGRA